MIKIGKRLQELIEIENVENKNLASALGLTDSSLISKWIYADTIPSFEHSIKIADYFNVSLDYFFGRTDDYSKCNFKTTPPFYEQLLKVMKEHKKTQYQLIKDKVVLVNSFHMWNKQKRLPKMETLIKLADYLGITLDYLVGRE